MAEGFEVNVVVLDKGEDPDTFIRKQGPDAYRERLRTSRPYLEYLLDQAAAGLDFEQDESRRQFLGKMLAVAAQIPEAAARDQFADRIAHKARVTEEVVRAEIRKAAVQRQTDADRPGAARVWAAETRGKRADLGRWSIIAARRSSALAELDADDLTAWPAGTVFEVARTCRIEPPDTLTNGAVAASKYR